MSNSLKIAYESMDMSTGIRLYTVVSEAPKTRQRAITVWNDTELHRLFTLRAQGKKWREIGEQMGHSTSSITGAYQQHLGTWLSRHPEDADIIERCHANAGTPKSNGVKEQAATECHTPRGMSTYERTAECRRRLIAWGKAQPPTVSEREWLCESLLELLVDKVA